MASQLDGHEFEQALGDGEGQGSLVCCSPRGCKESDVTEGLDSKKKNPPDFKQQLFGLKQVSWQPHSCFFLFFKVQNSCQCNVKTSPSLTEVNGTSQMMGELLPHVSTEHIWGEWDKELEEKIFRDDNSQT